MAAAGLNSNLNVESKQRTEELLKELVLSRDSLIKEAKFKRDKAHQEADTWYQNTTATITKVYDKLQAQILQFMSKIDLHVQVLQQSLETIQLQHTDEDLKQAQSSLDELQSSVTSLKKTTIWPAKFWSVNVGKITDDFTVQLGYVTEPTLKLPDVNSFPYTIKKHKKAELAKLNVRKQTPQQLGFRLSDLPMQPACHWDVGMTTNEAVVCFKGQSSIKKIAFKSNKISDLYQKPLPGRLDLYFKKYILNNNYVLLRDPKKGPSYLLDSQLELVSTVQEDYGWIRGAENTNWVAFYKEFAHTVQIYDLEHKQVRQTLTPSAGVAWVCPSICRNPDLLLTAVVDCTISSMCIYDHDGRHLHTHKLQLQPFPQHAIACNRRHLYVLSLDPVSVFVFSWSGQLITKLVPQQLGMPEGQMIWNIAVDEDQFTIAVGDADVNSFKTFQCV